MKRLTALAGFVIFILAVAFPIFIFFHEAGKADLVRVTNPNYAAPFSKVLSVLMVAGVPGVLLGVIGFLFLRRSLSGQAERFRWANAPIAFLIALTSTWILYATVERDYFDYIYFPKVKAQDGYIYPQLRYAIFDVVLILWCVDGLIATYFLARDFRARRNMSEWSYRSSLVFVVLFCVLLIGGFFGMCLRDMGL